MQSHNEQGELVGGRSNTISDTTAEKAKVLANDALLSIFKAHHQDCGGPIS
ncbi:hypothetical protein ACQKNX_04330 [Lysinibacillus sp. NPDC093712]|uniref:hypothetical protein n=1 Tax=Lysinibacillus sp. NPDC093712 TaxID=3390579 RepID=UPI003D02F698